MVAGLFFVGLWTLLRHLLWSARCGHRPGQRVGTNYSTLTMLSPMLVFGNMGNRTMLLMVVAFSAFTVSCNRNKYEVVERSEKEVPNFMELGTHSEVHYVLLNGGHKFYATCDWQPLIHTEPLRELFLPTTENV